MSEVVTIGNATLYHGDCLEILSVFKVRQHGPTLPFIESVVTDPPYGIGFKYGDSYEDAGDESYIEMLCNFQGVPMALLQYPEEMMSLVVPALGPPDEVLAWCYPSNLKRQFRLWGLWGLKADFSKVKQKCRNPESSKVKSLLVDSYDWWEQPQVKNVSTEKSAHPCQIPVSSVERVLKLTGVWNVLDPFMGSGTTGVACANLGLQFIGIEIERKYFDIACERIEAAQAQQRLFV